MGAFESQLNLADALSRGVLAQATLSYAPMIDRHRKVIGMRLVVCGTDGTQPSMSDVVRALRDIVPEEEIRLSVHVVGADVDPALFTVPGSRAIAVEIPAAYTVNPECFEYLPAFNAVGHPLVLYGVPPSALDPKLFDCFKHSVVDLSEDRRIGEENRVITASATRRIPFVQSGIRTVAALEASFARNCYAVIGWPFDDVLRSSSVASSNPDFVTITKLMQMVDQQVPVEQIEPVMKRDPALGYRLLRYINSPAFGLSVVIQSFKHAVMMLGYNRLKRWLALLLATSSKDVMLRPVMYSSMRRGMFMERVVGKSVDQELRDEMFICGVFSQLDRLFHTSFEQLFAMLNVPENVRNALVHRTGPHMPYLQLAEAVEVGDSELINKLVTDNLMSLAAVNAALIDTLVEASKEE
ncbi:EAL and HDOD domain-containing protein [Piscinibacterium candidicorallinum]|uniref:EAL and HDOD domain-containing protein n=1 Tax=Piscinibacterium candidicorallinum TaxID=1793872 RepID=A0ABV7H994_9BURK